MKKNKNMQKQVVNNQSKRINPTKEELLREAWWNTVTNRRDVVDLITRSLPDIRESIIQATALSLSKHFICLEQLLTKKGVCTQEEYRKAMGFGEPPEQTANAEGNNADSETVKEDGSDEESTTGVGNEESGAGRAESQTAGVDKSGT